MVDIAILASWGVGMAAVVMFARWLDRNEDHARRCHETYEKIRSTGTTLESWEYAPVEGYDWDYIITIHGDVISLKRDKPKLLKGSDNGHGYDQVRLCKQGKYQAFLIHRLVAMAFIPNPDGKPWVNHKDLCKKNNHVDNLEWTTPAENSRHHVDMRKEVMTDD